MANGEIKLDTSERKGLASTTAMSGLGGAMTGGKIGSVIPGVGSIIGAGVGLLAGSLVGGITASKQMKKEKALEKEIAQQQKEQRSDQAAMARASGARQQLKDRQREAYMFQPEDEVFLASAGNPSTYDRFMSATYGA